MLLQSSARGAADQIRLRGIHGNVQAALLLEQPVLQIRNVPAALAHSELCLHDVNNMDATGEIEKYS